MKRVTHSYNGIESGYRKSRKGTPGFATFIVSKFCEACHNRTGFRFVEIGIGSGRQTEFIEKELHDRGILDYKILAYDKSTGQLNVVADRIETGELSDRVVPGQLDIENSLLPLDASSIDMSYMAHVYHHFRNKPAVYTKLGRVTRKGGMHFTLGVAVDNLAGHPLDDFFPERFEIETNRYCNEEQLRAIYTGAGFSFEKPYRIVEKFAVPIDRDFLTSIEDNSQDSGITILREENPAAFEKGLKKVRDIVEQGERSGNYSVRLFGGRLQVFWGIKE